MKLQNYINERIKFDNIQEPEEMAEFIKDNCKPFLKEWSKDYIRNQLYTGRQKNSQFWYLKTVRKDRRPTDMPKNWHDWFNDFFKKKFGIYLRSETIFCTSDISIAQDYGAGYSGVYVIIPVGKYSLYYNTEINDLFHDLCDSTLIIRNDDIEFHNDVREDRFYKLMDTYKKGTLKEASRADVEVMMHTDKVLLIHMSKIDDVIRELRG